MSYYLDNKCYGYKTCFVFNLKVVKKHVTKWDLLVNDDMPNEGEGGSIKSPKLPYVIIECSLLP
jgi:hypothetical protein